MMEKRIKNMEHSTVFSLAGQVEYLPGQVASKTLAQNIYSSPARPSLCLPKHPMRSMCRGTV